ncbi:hypothetical protein CEXT_580111 [Caerostris extrusa]|uniref:Uncharacterized protein n=1 Tax=Caerostris extrusa TaxID=172846 RepID=A0AAV4M9Y0_CAEEX|nr:hypothetical protein CEXT_580111 [Caerostris extrusa]
MKTVPNVLYAFLALSGSLVTLLLPETRDLDLPDTLQEAADMERPLQKSQRHGVHASYKTIGLIILH